MKKINLTIVSVLLAVLVAPQLALAAWWNPFSWFSWQQSNTTATVTGEFNPFGTPLPSRPATLNIQATSSLPTAETFPVITITANPTKVTPGKPTIITWSTTNADYCVSSDADPIAWFFTGGAVNGSVQTLPLTANRTYIMKCMSADGGLTTQSITVAVITPVVAIRTETRTRTTTTIKTGTPAGTTVITTPSQTAPAPTLTLSASPLTVTHNGKTRLSWASTNTTSCTAFGGGWSGSKQVSSSEYSAELLGPASYTFSIACTGLGGGVEKSVTVYAQATEQTCPWYGCWLTRNPTSVDIFKAPNTVVVSTIPAVIISKLNDTGITVCGDATTMNQANCAIVATDGGTFPRQDARYGRDAAAQAGTLTKVGGGHAGFDFTKIANNGSTLSQSATQGTGSTDWACTKDNVTGLVWEVKTTSGLHKQSDTFTWSNTGTFVNNVNATSFCGYSDWRLPTLKELENIVDFSRINPPIDTGYFPNTNLKFYWSSTDSSLSLGHYWIVDFMGSNVTIGQSTTPQSVRLVRGASMSTNQFTITNGGLTVTDASTGLMWKRDYEMRDPANPGTWQDWKDTFSWPEALQRPLIASNANFAGYSDWRLPNVKELRSLISETRHKPAIDTAVFPPTIFQAYFWSASPAENFNKYQNLAWTVSFDIGSALPKPRYFVEHVRLVRTITFGVAPTPALTPVATLNATSPSAGTVNFSWSVTNSPTACIAGIGDANGNTVGHTWNTQNMPASGTKTLTGVVAGTYSYSLSCLNASGTGNFVTRLVTVLGGATVTLSNAKMSTSNSATGPFVQNGTVYNNLPVYVRTENLVSGTQGCMQLVGGNTCNTGQGFRVFTSAEWINTTTVQTVIPNPLIYPVASYEIWIKVGTAAPVKIGVFALRAPVTATPALCPDGTPRQTVVSPSSLTGCEGHGEGDALPPPPPACPTPVANTVWTPGSGVAKPCGLTERTSTNYGTVLLPGQIFQTPISYAYSPLVLTWVPQYSAEQHTQYQQAEADALAEGLEMNRAFMAQYGYTVFTSDSLLNEGIRTAYATWITQWKITHPTYLGYTKYVR